MREPISKLDSLIVFRRDAWSCRYCNDGVFFMPSLKILDSLNPGHGYYHAHGKTGAVLDVFQWKWATVDHIMPVAHGGQNALDNYVTACWRCNLMLSDSHEDKDKSVLLNEVNHNMAWDGFSGLYLQLGPNDSWRKLISLSDDELINLKKAA
jgi:hypothetical protein